MVNGIKWTQTRFYLSILSLNHFPSQVPKIRGPFRTTTSSLEIGRHSLIPWRIFIKKKKGRYNTPTPLAELKHKLGKDGGAMDRQNKSILPKQGGGGRRGERKGMNVKGLMRRSLCSMWSFLPPEQLGLLSTDSREISPGWIHNNIIASSSISMAVRVIWPYLKGKESPYLEVIHVEVFTNTNKQWSNQVSESSNNSLEGRGV